MVQLVEVESGSAGTNLLSELTKELIELKWEPQPGSSSKARCIFGLPDRVVTQVNDATNEDLVQLLLAFSLAHFCDDRFFYVFNHEFLRRTATRYMRREWSTWQLANVLRSYSSLR